MLSVIHVFVNISGLASTGDNLTSFIHIGGLLFGSNESHVYLWTLCDITESIRGILYCQSVLRRWIYKPRSQIFNIIVYFLQKSSQRAYVEFIAIEEYKNLICQINSYFVVLGLTLLSISDGWGQPGMFLQGLNGSITVTAWDLNCRSENHVFSRFNLKDVESSSYRIDTVHLPSLDVVNVQVKRTRIL